MMKTMNYLERLLFIGACYEKHMHYLMRATDAHVVTRDMIDTVIRRIDSELLDLFKASPVTERESSAVIGMMDHIEDAMTFIGE